MFKATFCCLLIFYRYLFVWLHLGGNLKHGHKNLCVLLLAISHHKYATPEIPIVIVWNGLNHYVPTYSSNESVLLHWKMSLINRHITEATSLFGEIENDLNDQTDFDLCEQFHLLKSTADLSKQMLEKKQLVK